MKTIIEPFRIKSVEPIRMTSRAERRELIAAARFNLFALHSDDVLIDLLTDSGTSAMSARQWAAIQQGDESYAGSPSFRRFEAAVRNLMPFRHIIPTHQGRAAEAILFHLLGGPGGKIPSNTHFDTTRGNIEATGAQAHDLVIPEGRDPQALHPFKGNMDVERLADFLAAHAADVPLRDADGDQQRRRRPAGQSRQHPRRRRAGASIRQAVHHRRLPLRRERLVHQDARAGPGQPRRRRHRARHVR